MSIDKKIKEKKKKRNINNDLANLPSHDNHSYKVWYESADEGLIECGEV